MEWENDDGEYVGCNGDELLVLDWIVVDTWMMIWLPRSIKQKTWTQECLYELLLTSKKPVAMNP